LPPPEALNVGVTPASGAPLESSKVMVTVDVPPAVMGPVPTIVESPMSVDEKKKPEVSSVLQSNVAPHPDDNVETRRRGGSRSRKKVSLPILRIPNIFYQL
jgi:hypothetical protein